MRLTALDITGFKSFAKPSHLEFREGVTAIVGPNGSGKSNIADAIRWALGEQSMKTLRGKKSEDVIFSGGPTRGRLGMAAVSLTLLNDDDHGPVDAAEVVITRQLTRAGESSYLVNNRPVRLLDVAEILAKAGFGQKTYTVIGQGMAEAFVNASPTERRAMFEDATGVTPLLLKKEQTERRLAQTREHTLRARDLLRELEPRLRSLKRQASRARSRRELEEELKAAEAAWCTHLWTTYTDALMTSQARTREIDGRIATLTERIASLRPPDTSIEGAARLPTVRERIERLQEEEQGLTIELAHAGGFLPEGAIDREEEERHAKEKEHQKLSGLLEETTSALKEKQEILERVRRDIRHLQEELLALHAVPLGSPRAAHVAKELEAILARHEALIERLHATEDLEELGGLAEDAEETKTLLQQLLLKVRPLERTGSRTAPLAELKESLEQRTKDHERTEREVTEVRVRAATLGTRLTTIEDRLRELSERAKARRPSAEPSLTARLETVRAERAALSTEAKSLEALLLRAHTERRTSDAELEHLRGQLHAAEEEKHTIAVTVAGTAARKEDVEREAATSLGEEFLRDLRAGRAPRPDLKTVDTLEASVNNLREKVGAIGMIDTSVLEEEAAVEGRVRYLREQIHDLDRASARLREGVRELDTYIHRQFSEGMNAMHENFNTYFRQIFGGGRAGLSIVKPRPVEHALPDLPDDLPADASAEAGPVAHADTTDEERGAHVHELPAGVEIRANPPGKKLTSISQLSGGEKALTSVALLFAILRERPSPFIVLDEVDAALDEANSRRFARMLAELARSLQFLVITHNRATMEAAGALYGVTMSDDGVSQLLSIRLSEVPERLGEEAETPHPNRLGTT